jgi:hypothetical protein
MQTEQINTFDALLEAMAFASSEAEKQKSKAQFDEFRKTVSEDVFWKLMDKKSAEIGAFLEAIQAQDQK